MNFSIYLILLLIVILFSTPLESYNFDKPETPKAPVITFNDTEKKHVYHNHDDKYDHQLKIKCLNKPYLNECLRFFGRIENQEEAVKHYASLNPDDHRAFHWLVHLDMPQNLISVTSYNYQPPEAYIL